MNTNPAKAIAGAITIRRKLKISGLNSVSVEPGPVIKAKPMITAMKEMAMRI